MTSADVAIIRDWLGKNKYLPQNLDDYFIECFIKAAKGSVQRAKQTLENYCMIRHQQEFTYHIPPDPFSDVLLDTTNRLALVKLPKKTPEGYTIVLCYANKGEPDPHFSVKMMILSKYFIDTLLWEHDMDGECVLIADYRNTSLNDYTGLTPGILTNVAKILKGALPYRLKAVYDINVPSVAEWAFKLMKTFMSEKMNSRRFAYSNGDDIFKHVAQEILPAEYGGKEPSVFELYESTTKKLLHKYRDRFIAQKEQVLAEKPFLPGHLNIADYDTFRKLDID